MNKEILFGQDSRSRMLQGVQKISNAVRVTMGAEGKCVLISNAAYADGYIIRRPLQVSKDGWTVAKNFSLSDPIQEAGAMLVREAATKTVEVAGDSTTLCCVLAEFLMTEGVKLIDAGANSQQLKKGMDKALEYVVEELKKMSIPVRGDNERIKQIATVSANNDSEIGNLIADAYKKIGDDGVIDIEPSKTGKTEIKVYEGYKFEQGWEGTSPWFINKRAKEICEFENPYILLYEKHLIGHEQFSKILSIVGSSPIVIICAATESTALGVLIENNIRGNIQICTVNAPGYGILRGEMMEDMAILTGATYISDSKGIGIKEATDKQLGRAKKIIISKRETVIIGGDGDPEVLKTFITEKTATITEDKTEEERANIEKRIARLTGGFAVIQVGAATETEMKEKMDRVDDAVRATKASIAEGALAGGGTSFLRIEPFFDERSLGITDFVDGSALVFHSLKKPLMQICENAGIDGTEILKQVLAAKGNNGYNALTGEIVDMVETGIIDSTKALRCALTNAVSVAGMFLTSECAIIDIA